MNDNKKTLSIPEPQNILQNEEEKDANPSQSSTADRNKNIYEIWKPLLKGIAKEKGINIDEVLTKLIATYYSIRMLQETKLDEIREDIVVLSRILDQSNRDSFSINFNMDEDIEKAKIIQKYDIKFPKVENLEIVYNSCQFDLMKGIITKAFKSNLKNLKIDGNQCKFEQDKQSMFRSLKTQNSEVLLMNFVIGAFIPEILSCFNHADTIELRGCRFNNWNARKTFNFSGVHIKNIILDNVDISPIDEFIYFVLHESGFAKTLNKVSFINFSEQQKVELEEVIKDYQEGTKKNNLEIL